MAQLSLSATPDKASRSQVEEAQAIAQKLIEAERIVSRFQTGSPVLGALDVKKTPALIGLNEEADELLLWSTKPNNPSSVFKKLTDRIHKMTIWCLVLETLLDYQKQVNPVFAPHVDAQLQALKTFYFQLISTQSKLYKLFGREKL